MLQQEFEQVILKHGLLKKREKILVGFSGGPDSCCLMNLLVFLRPSWGFQIYASHLNHGLRGKDSEADARWVKTRCQQLDIPLFMEKTLVSGYGKANGLSLEEAGRKLRYDLFARVCRRLKIKKVLLGHTADDQVETVLLCLLRGTGKKGLAGMSFIDHHGGAHSMKLVRPLLTFWKKELLGYLKDEKIPFRIDATNLENDFLRNRVRNKLIPILQTYNSQAKKHLLSLAWIAEADEQALTGFADRWFQGNVRKNRLAFSFTLSSFRRLKRAVQVRVLRKMIESLKGNLNRVSFVHYEQLMVLVNSTISGESYGSLPKGLCARKSYSNFSIEKYTAELEPIKNGRQLSIPGVTFWPYVQAALGRRDQPVSSGNVVFFETSVMSGRSRIDWSRSGKRGELFDLDELELPLKVRSVKNGDRFNPLGFKGHKKLQDLFVDNKVPKSQRPTIPVLVDGKGNILWVVGLRRADTAKITNRTKRILNIRLEGIKSSSYESA